MSPRLENRLVVLEEKVTNFLQKYAKDEYSKNEMAVHVAKTSLMPNHLFEDLGFRNRFEMGVFMKKHFPELSKMKPKEKLWKKFIYDSIGEVAPACAKCADQVDCFTCKII
jgi:nitrogen fixation protein NifQ